MVNPAFVGIWLDYRHADVLHYNGSQITHSVIKGDISARKTRGGSRSSSSWGPQQVVSETKQLHRREQAIADYYEKIIHEIGDANHAIILFGPAEAKDGLVKAIVAKKMYRPGVLRVVTKDKMTLNQKKSFVLDAYTELIAFQII